MADVNGVVLVNHNPSDWTPEKDYEAVEEGETKKKEEETPPGDGREEWGSQVEFILSTVGSVVGLGNLWRFPIKVQKYGGAVFLIPYFIMLFIEGIPLFLVELWIGQKFRVGCIAAFYKIHKSLTGIGFATWMIGFYTNLYYNAIIMYTIYYFFASFQKTLPWAADCPIAMNDTDYPAACCGETNKASYYWYYDVLKISPSMGEAQEFNWQLTLCLLAAWLTCFLCMVKGIKTSGKVVYVTAVFPFIALFGLFIMSMTLGKGAYAGIGYFFDPTYKFPSKYPENVIEDAVDGDEILSNWRHLSNPYCWMEAATQIFYSLSLGFGSCIAFASYNPPKTNFFKYALGISVINSATSIFAGMTIFAIVGSSAYDRNSTITDVGGGPGLAFIAVSEAITSVPAAQLWSALFFIMLFMLGIDSQFAGMEGMMTALEDTTLLPKKIPRPIVIAVFCAGSFLLGLPFSMNNGQYLVDLFDNYSANFPLMLVAFFEVISVSWVYGINRFCADFEDMTGYYPNIVWKILWVAVTPISLAFVLIYSIVDQFSSTVTYAAFVGCQLDEDIWFTSAEYPGWGYALAIFLVFSSFLFIPGFAFLAGLPHILRELGYPGVKIRTPLIICAQEEAAKEEIEMC